MLLTSILIKVVSEDMFLLTWAIDVSLFPWQSDVIDVNN